MDINDQQGPDPTLCVVVEQDVGDRVRVIDLNGMIKCSRQTAEDLIRRERLTTVTRSELRSLATTCVRSVNWDALLRDPNGSDDGDVKTWKKVARLQERFRDQGDGFAWWGRFCAVNPPGTCAAIVELLHRVVDQHGAPAGKSNRDWMELLRNAVAISIAGTVTSIGKALLGLAKPKADE